MPVKQVDSKEVESQDLIKVTEEPHIIQCRMNEQERSYDQDQLLQCLQKIRDLDSEKKATNAEFTARAKKLQETCDDLQAGLMSGKKMRSVLCTLTLNYSRLVAELKVKETGELIQQRPMTDEERRMNPTAELPFEEDPPEEDKAPDGELPFEEPEEEKPSDPTDAPTVEAETQDPPSQESDNAQTVDGQSEPQEDPEYTMPEDAEALTPEEANAIADDKMSGLPAPLEEQPEQQAPEPSDPDADADLEFWLGSEE